MANKIKNIKAIYEFNHYDANFNAVYNAVKCNNLIKSKYPCSQIVTYTTENGLKNYEFYSENHNDLAHLSYHIIGYDNRNNPKFELDCNIVDDSYNFGDLTGTVGGECAVMATGTILLAVALTFSSCTGF